MYKILVQILSIIYYLYLVLSGITPEFRAEDGVVVSSDIRILHIPESLSCHASVDTNRSRSVHYHLKTICEAGWQKLYITKHSVKIYCKAFYSHTTFALINHHFVLFPCSPKYQSTRVQCIPKLFRQMLILDTYNFSDFNSVVPNVSNIGVY